MSIDEVDLAQRYMFSVDVIKHLKKIYNEKIEEVLKALKNPGSRYYIRVNTLKSEPKLIIERLGRKGVNAYQHRVLREAIFTPIIGPLKIPEYPRKVVVDKKTAESVLLGANVYAPGVNKCEKLKKSENVQIVDEYGQPVGSGISRMSENEILKFRRGLAIEVTQPKFRTLSIRDSEEFNEGLIYPQSFPAMVTSRVLEPEPGETVVDLNCSPGGKLTHISQLMNNTGRIIGVDRNNLKISAAHETVTRLGCRNIELISHDARYLDVDYPKIRADKCLVDPPCSALGVIPKLYEYASNAEIIMLSNYQKHFLKVASKIVKKGGIIVYSVCTITLEECEEVVKFGVEECGLEIEKQQEKFFFGSKGINKNLEEASLTQRFHPHLHGAGYFIARFKKTS
jgi:16S rRNA (cytosine967-C5)-methyltransferase